MKAFEGVAFGKWILAGEHAVLRGSPALVFPVKSCFLKLQYQPTSSSSTELQLSGPYGEEIRLLFWGVFEQALKMCGKNLKDRGGEFHIESGIPVGAGLGASAALCVALGKWCLAQGWISEIDLYDFSRSLEDLFHGESSGVDIAVALSGEGLKFKRGGLREPLATTWSPRWFLSYSGRRGMTSECVTKVKSLFGEDREKAQALDDQMRLAVEMAEAALMENGSSGFDKLSQSIDLALKCFEKWGLTEGEMGQHLSFLRSQGAVAVKPTGSGGGGYALSLWKAPPPENLKGLIQI
ncbi:MAG: hypothetical protein KDD22_06525 [Bdellovibrionales bacterium]|nr:hypothetical protein [Bdellovibrionales bacterium]